MIFTKATFIQEKDELISLQKKGDLTNYEEGKLKMALDLENLILGEVGVTLKDEKKRCYTTWKKHNSIKTIYKQKYIDANGKVLKARDVRKMYREYLSL